jgi:hypothetical protein
VAVGTALAIASRACHRRPHSMPADPVTLVMRFPRVGGAE